MIYELAALTAAFIWSLTGIVSVGPAKRLGGFSFNRIRIIFVALLILLIVLVKGGWQDIDQSNLYPLALSGLVGIFLGDSLLFSALKQVGPRINAILYSMNAPLAAILGYFYLDEKLSTGVFIGCLLMTIGIVIAIAFGKRQVRAEVRHNTFVSTDDEDGNIWLGVSLGLGAATCQAIGTIIAKPIMAAGIDPLEGASIRTGATAVVMLMTLAFHNDLHRIKKSDWGSILLSAILGIGIGMTLVLFALIGGDSGVVSTLSSLSPVMMLPIIWLISGKPPRGWAWLGAILASIGTALVFLY